MSLLGSSVDGVNSYPLRCTSLVACGCLTPRCTDIVRGKKQMPTRFRRAGLEVSSSTRGSLLFPHPRCPEEVSNIVYFWPRRPKGRRHSRIKEVTQYWACRIRTWRFLRM